MLPTVALCWAWTHELVKLKERLMLPSQLVSLPPPSLKVMDCRTSTSRILIRSSTTAPACPFRTVRTTTRRSPCTRPATPPTRVKPGIHGTDTKLQAHTGTDSKTNEQKTNQTNLTYSFNYLRALKNPKFKVDCFFHCVHFLCECSLVSFCFTSKNHIT